MPAAAMMAGAANAQAGPTVVWYGVSPGASSTSTNLYDRVYRAWSDGTIEMKRVQPYAATDCFGGPNLVCTSVWVLVSSPTNGFKAAADINADELVDGADLASVLGNWGDAPRVPFPPSDCPLNLINP
jgi:hypothetical protein